MHPSCAHRLYAYYIVHPSCASLCNLRIIMHIFHASFCTLIMQPYATLGSSCISLVHPSASFLCILRNLMHISHASFSRTKVRQPGPPAATAGRPVPRRGAVGLHRALPRQSAQSLHGLRRGVRPSLPSAGRRRCWIAAALRVCACSGCRGRAGGARRGWCRGCRGGAERALWRRLCPAAQTRSLEPCT